MGPWPLRCRDLDCLLALTAAPAGGFGRSVVLLEFNQAYGVMTQNCGGWAAGGASPRAAAAAAGLGQGGGGVHSQHPIDVGRRGHISVVLWLVARSNIPL